MARPEGEHKVAITASISPDTSRRCEQIADDYCRRNKSEVVEWAVDNLYATIMAWRNEDGQDVGKKLLKLKMQALQEKAK